MSGFMAFPETVEEFMEQYKITDTEQIYTNGAELIPIFRMKQWFEHIGDAVPVARCENCIYGKPYNEVWYQPKRDSMWCKKYETEHEYGWFCADGENVTVGALIAKILRQTERR